MPSEIATSFRERLSKEMPDVASQLESSAKLPNFLGTTGMLRTEGGRASGSEDVMGHL